MKRISACTSGQWTYDEATGCSEWCPDSLVTHATREHERLSVRYHNLHITSHRDNVMRAIERIHADGAEHIVALVY